MLSQPCSHLVDIQVKSFFFFIEAFLISTLPLLVHGIRNEEHLAYQNSAICSHLDPNLACMSLKLLGKKKP